MPRWLNSSSSARAPSMRTCAPSIVNWASLRAMPQPSLPSSSSSSRGFCFVLFSPAPTRSFQRWQVPFTEAQHSFETIVISGGQAGLAMRYYLRALGHRFVILDAGSRVEEAWRERWDELYLFTRAALDALPGLPFPAAPA